MMKRLALDAARWNRSLPVLAAWMLLLPMLLMAPARAEVAYHPIDLTPVANASLNGLVSDFDQKLPPGTNLLGGIPFVMPAGPLNYWTSNTGSAPDPRTAELSVGVEGARDVYALLNTVGGAPGPQSYAALEFFGSNGAYYRKDLVGDEDVRNLSVQFGSTRRVNLTTTVPVMTYWTGPAHLDRVRIPLPKEFEGQALTKIRIVDNGGGHDQRLFCAGVTVAAGTPEEAPPLEYFPVDFSAGFNDRLQKHNEGFPAGDLVLGGVPFILPADGNNAWAGYVANVYPPRALEIPVGIAGVREVYTLLNMDQGNSGPGLASVEFFGSDGAYYKKELAGGEDIRDLGTFRFTTNVNGTTSVPVVDPGDGSHLDRQRFVLPPEFASQTLARIVVNDVNALLVLSGITVGRTAGSSGILLGAVPTRIGNGAPATLTLFGTGFAPDTAVRLTKEGWPDLLPTTMSVSESGKRIYATFDLTDQPPGLWQLVVKTAAGSGTLPGGITVVSGGEPRPAFDLLGHPWMRGGRPQAYTLLFENRGSLDARGVAVKITAPDFVQIGAGAPLAEPPTPEGGTPIDYSQVPVAIHDGEENALWIYLPFLPAGAAGSFPLTFTAPAGPEYGHRKFQVKIYYSTPAFVAGLGMAPETFYTSIVGDALASLGVTPEPVAVGQGVLAAMGGIDARFQNASVLGEGPPPPLALAATAVSAVAATLRQMGRSFPEGQIRAAATEAAVQHLGGDTPAAPGALPLQDDGPDDWPDVPPPPAPNGGSHDYEDRTPNDPNDKAGPSGAGEPRFITGQEPLRYLVMFENKETATASAQEVTVTDPLDPATMDLDTLELGPITFGSHTLTPPPGLSEWTTDVDLRPGMNLILRVEAKLDRGTNVLTWKFTSLDPATMKLTTDPEQGFLPPDTASPEGEGSAFFRVEPKPGLPTGTEIKNKASIVFDVNAAIDTPEWVNTIDNLRPSSAVNPLPMVTKTTDFRVSWAGTDQGAGVKSYTVSVSENGGPFAVWIPSTADTSAVFTGAVGMTYRFMSAAVDATGNEEPPHLIPDAVTKAGSLTLGDADLNGVVDVRDAILVLRGLVGLEMLTPDQTAAADIVTDESIDVLDAVGILRKIVGLP